MAITRTTRIPREGQVFRTPWWPRKDTCDAQTVVSLHKGKPAWFLPIIGKELNKMVPFVMYPGTIVGVLNDRDHTDVSAAHRAQSPSILVPAHGHASGYNLVYTALDLATDEFGGTYDLDETAAETIVAAAGASTVAVAKTRPLGVIQDLALAEQYFRRHLNLNLAYPNMNILSGGKELRIPVITDEEQDIYPGDRVMVSDSAGDWDPINNPGTSYPGRWKKVDESGAYIQEALVMGRCVARHRLCAQSSVSADQSLAAAVSADNVDVTTLNEDQGYDILNRVQTVPGLGLQGSGTKGNVAAMMFARSDAAGDFWAIDVALSVSGI